MGYARTLCMYLLAVCSVNVYVQLSPKALPLAFQQCLVDVNDFWEDIVTLCTCVIIYYVSDMVCFVT